MKEANLVDRVLRACEKVMPGGVGFKHADYVTSGIPDASWTWNGKTAWMEFKFRGGEISEIQKITLRRLERASMAFIIWLMPDDLISVFNGNEVLLFRFKTAEEVAKFVRKRIDYAA